MAKVRQRVFVLVLIVIILIPTTLQDVRIVDLRSNEEMAISDWAGEWPTWYPTLNKLFENPIHLGIQTLNGTPEGLYVEIEINFEIVGFKMKWKPKMAWREKADHIEFEFTLGIDWCKPSDKDKLELTGPLNALGMILNPPEEFRVLTHYECRFYSTFTFKMTLQWYWHDDVWEIPQGSVSGGMYYTISTNVLKLFLTVLAPAIGLLGYEVGNCITAGALDNIAVAEVTLGLNVTFARTQESQTLTFNPFVRLDVEIPSEEMQCNLVEFDLELAFLGYLKYETYYNGRCEHSFKTKLEASLDWRILAIGGSHKWTMFEYTWFEIIVDKRTELRDLEVANGEEACTQGDTVNIGVALVDSEGVPIDGQTVRFQYRGEGGEWNDVATAITDSNGYCFTNWICSLSNDTYEIRAKYDGTSDHNPSQSVVKSLTVELDLRATLIHDLQFGTSEEHLIVRPGESIRISTYTVEPGVGGIVGIPIDFFVSTDDRLSWTYIGTSVTVGWGYASVDWIVPADLESGDHYFRAAYRGDYTYDAAISENEIRLVIESVKFVSHSDGEVISTVTPTFGIDISEGVPHDRVTFRIDWDTPVDLPAGTTEWTSYPLLEGEHIIRVYLYQGLDVRGVDYITITVDAYHPLLILSPQADDYVQASFAVEWEWQGGEPYDRVELLVDGSIVYSHIYSQTVGLLVTDAGLHSLTLRAWLDAVAETASVDFIVDRVRPTITIDSPAPSTEFGLHSVLLEWSASDDNQLDRFEILIDGALTETISDPTTMSTTINVDSGPHTIEVFAYDASQMSSGASVDISVKTAEPWVTITSPQDGTVLGSQTVDLYWTWWSTSPYDRFEVYIDAIYNMTVYDQNTNVRVETGIHTLSIRGYLIDESYHSDSVEIEIDPTVSLIGEWDTGIYVGDAPGLTYAPHRYHYACALDFCGDSKSEVVVAWLEYNPSSDYIIHMKMYLMGGTELFHWTMLSDENVWSEQEKIDDIVIVELDGDGQDEFVVSTIYGVTAFNYVDSAPYYTEMWSYMDWGYIHTLDARDIDGDGFDEVWSGGAALLLDHDGSVIWSYDTVSNNFHTWFSKDPTESKFVELDGDAEIEVLLSGWGNILAGNHDGSELWTYDYCYDEYSSVGEAHYDIGNVDLDSLDEILLYNHAGYRLTLMDSDSSIIWDTTVSDHIYDARLIDVDSDGISEILLLLGNSGYVNNFTILDAFGNMIRTMELEDTYANPYARWRGIEVANIDNDPELEVIIPHADRVRVMSVECVVELEADCASTHWCPRSQFPVDYDGDGSLELGVWFTPPFMVFRIAHDIESPNVEIQYPPDSGVVPSSFVVNWTATDNKAVVFSEVWANAILVANTTDSIVVISLSEGHYTIEVRSYDARRNVGTDEIDFFVDATPPSIVITSPESGFNSSSRQVTFSWDVIGHDRVLILLGGYELASTSTSQLTVSLPVGSHNVTCRAYDQAGNFAEDWALVTVDTTAPDVLITMPTENILIGGNSTEVSWTVVEYGTGIAGIYLYVNELLFGEQNYSALLTDLQEGPNNVTILCLDFAGNVGSDSIMVIVDLINPGVTVIAPSGFIYHSGELHVSIACHDSSGIWKAQVTIDGVHTKPLVIDSIVDSIEIWTTDLNMSMFSDGYHVFSFLVHDGVGHVNSTSTIVETVTDADDPIVLILSPQNGIETRNTTVTLRWNTTDDSGVDYCEILVDSVVVDETTEETYELLLDEGTHNVGVRAIDLALRESTAEITVIVDQTAPDVLISNPLNEQRVSGNIVVESEISEVNTIVLAQLYVDDVVMDSDTVAPWRFNIDTDALSDGSHILEVRAMDLAGNIGQHEIVILTGDVVTTTTITPTVTEPAPLSDLIETLMQLLLSPIGLGIAMIAIITILAAKRRNN